MVVGEMPEGVDLLVVGGGPGGYVAALAAARLGRKVVLVDADGEDGLGGICVRVGCIPSKALIEFATHVHAQTVWNDRGGPLPAKGDIDLQKFQTWKSEVVDGLNAGIRGLLRTAGVDVRRGWFRFTRPDQGALVTDPERPPTHLQFKSCILATGSRPLNLECLPFDGKRVVSSTEVLTLTALPKAVAVVGGGYVGLELGTALAKLGSSVTIVEARGSLLPTMDHAIGALISESLNGFGVRVLTNSQVIEDDGTHLHVSCPTGNEELPVDLIIVAIGRVPNTDDVGLGALGVKPDPDGRLTVSSNLLITPHVAAIGDITPGPALAHKASAEAHVAAAVLSGRPERFEPATVPAVVFTDPEVAQAGLTTVEAEAIGHHTGSANFPVSASGRARTMGERQGFAEYVYDIDTGLILGATIVGPHASELITEAALAIEMVAHLDDIAGTIHPHPTMSELHHEAALVALDRPLHIAAVTRRDSGDGDAA